VLAQLPAGSVPTVACLNSLYTVATVPTTGGGAFTRESNEKKTVTVSDLVKKMTGRGNDHADAIRNFTPTKAPGVHDYQ